MGTVIKDMGIVIKDMNIVIKDMGATTTDLLSRNGKNIAFADYSPLWKAHRRLVHSAFTMFGEGTCKLETMVSQETEKLCSQLQETLGTPVDLGPELIRAITNVVCTLVFNSSYEKGDPEFHMVMDYNNGIVETIAGGSLVDTFPWLKATYHEGETRDLLDALLKAQHPPRESAGAGKDAEGISDDHVLMTVADAFGAGVETTATVLRWTIAFLLHHPEVQQRIQEEIDDKIGPDRHLTLMDRGKLPYLESTLNEVLRIRPVTPLLIPHVALEDTSIGEYFIPKGTRVIVNMWSIHHDPQEWTDPEEFKPDRFLDSNGLQISLPSFIPFGAGPRVCVGESLAKIELFLFASRLLQCFTFRNPPGAPLPDLEGKYGLVLQPKEYRVCILDRRQ
nr:PREDICTED: steroid 17-alpha-hydroxylase/17,20 lyase-like [Latimeria chalumnae]|eukprot:XP_014339337.1 PREDICTED: steroid 17-alpha-hydroxylase/17,20 lyase-like [Latimeria chalumnae]